jgi:hypothetical protein
VRYVRRPLWWAVGAAVFIAIAVAAHVPEVRADDATYAQPSIQTATASSPAPNTDLVDVTYTDPSTGREVHAAFVDRGAGPVPSDGRMALEVSSTDPTAVRPVGETRSYADDWPFYAVLLGVPLVAWAFRRHHVRRLELLMASAGPTFAMLAVVVPPGGIHRRWRLCLYPLNAGPGAPPVCAVELVWLPVCPPGAFAVDVKGEPSPFGSVAIRTGDDVFWPRGRALATRADVPRPLDVVRIPGRLPAPIQPPAPGERAPVPTSLLLRLLGLASLAVFTWLYSSFPWQVEQVLERSQPAVATVVGNQVDATTATFATVVSFDHDGTTQRADVLFDDPPRQGSTAPIRFDVADPSIAWPADGYGPGTSTDGLVFSITLPLALGLLTVASFAKQEELKRLGSRELATTGRVELGAFPR